MTTTDAKTELLRQISTEAQRSARALSLRTIAEEQHAMLERAGDLALAGLWPESRFVAEQARSIA